MYLLKRLLAITTVVVIFVSMIPFSDPVSAASFEAGNIIDESKFTASSSMTATDIQVFLNARNSVCLKDYQTPEPLGNNQYGGNVSAAQAIWNSGHLYGISPKVLLATLQKEQGLVTRSDCPDWRYRAAMGFGCPDSAPCDEQWYGLSKQLYQGARHLKGFYDQSPGWYIPYRPGNRFVQYSPNSACGGTTVNIQNRSTASLYSYTPYQPNAAALAAGYGTGDGCSAYGNRNFWLYYTAWFGSTRDGRCTSEPPAQSITGITFRKFASRVDQANLVIYSGSSTNCIESHTWNVGVTSWGDHTSSNHPISSPDIMNVQYADLNGDGIDEPILVGINNTATGMVEFHVWNRNMSSWQEHIASSLPTSSLANGRIVFADTNGDGRDEAVLILFNNTGSNRVEFHIFNDDLRSFKRQAATQISGINPASASIVFADLDGNRTDEPVLILYENTESGKVEFHTWNQDYATWRFNTASNLSVYTPTDAFITFADVDGNSVDEAVLISLRGNQSGRVEFHTWNPGVSSWRYHTASNQPAI